MAMFQESRIRQLLKIELWSFLIFIIFAFLFYQYKDAHIYYYKEDFFSHYNGVIALIAFLLFVCFFWISIFFPILWAIQLVILIRKRKIKKYWKCVLLITLFYLVSLIACFSLYSINQHQSFLERRSRAVKNTTTSEHWVGLQDITDDTENKKITITVYTWAKEAKQWTVSYDTFVDGYFGSVYGK